MEHNRETAMIHGSVTQLISNTNNKAWWVEKVFAISNEQVNLSPLPNTSFGEHLTR